ncbi:MAG: radical SAM family heme chaperone HemW [Candidatus Zixiibacteriota bacterium]
MNAIYLHIPFCVKRCDYCSFYSIEYNHRDIVNYCKALKKEIQIQAKLFQNKIIDTIYFGGGTPSVMETSQVDSIFESLNRYFNISAACEITFELNPKTVDKEYLQMLRKVGINRLSIGIQSLNNKELELLGRIHDSQKAIKALEDAREANFDNISVDIITAIPGQSKKDIRKSLEIITDYSPEHISIYDLSIDKGTKISELVNSKTLKANDNDKELYYFAIDFLAKAGFEHYEISSFAKKGFQSKHNNKYWERNSYIGLGASAHSMIADVRFNNPADMQKYLYKLDKNELPSENIEFLTYKDIISEFIMLGLRKTDGIDIGSIPKTTKYGKQLLGNIQELIRMGYLTQNNKKVAISHSHLFISNEIIIHIIP